MEHYFSKEQKSTFKIHKINATTFGNSLEFNSSSGVFSKDKPDFGSLVLINGSTIKDGQKILDMGCGYGLVGVSIAKQFPKCSIVMSDINKRAVRLAKMNVKLNKVKAKVIESDLYSKIDDKFDSVICNPPQKAGKEICFRMISEAKEHLAEGGLLQIVARHNKGGKALSEKMKEVFGNVAEKLKKSGYRVYVSKNGL